MAQSNLQLSQELMEKFHKDFHESGVVTSTGYTQVIEVSREVDLTWETIHDAWLHFRKTNAFADSKYPNVYDDNPRDDFTVNVYKELKLERVFSQFVVLDTEARSHGPLLLCFAFESGSEFHIRRVLPSDGINRNHVGLFIPAGTSNRSLAGDIRKDYDLPGQLLTVYFHVPPCNRA